jgi:hypothetical protein
MTFDELNNLKAVARKYGGLNLGEVDQLIDTAERHLASAEQVRQMRQALMLINETMPKGYECRITELSSAALALTPSQAEQQARENAEKAALLEWWFDESNEDARERIRFERWASDSPWTAEQWIDAVSKVKETPNAK